MGHPRPCPASQVNGVCMEGKQHGDVVSAIKAGGDEAKLLVVDKETDEFFKKCKVIPSQAHLDGRCTAGCPPARDVAKSLRLLGLQGRPNSMGWRRIEAGMGHECLRGQVTALNSHEGGDEVQYQGLA